MLQELERSNDPGSNDPVFGSKNVALNALSSVKPRLLKRLLMCVIEMKKTTLFLALVLRGPAHIKKLLSLGLRYLQQKAYLSSGAAVRRGYGQAARGRGVSGAVKTGVIVEQGQLYFTL